MLVQLEEPVHGTKVDDDGSGRRNGPADDARAAPERHHGRAVALRELDRLRHLGGAARLHDAGRRRSEPPLPAAQVREDPVVDTVGGERLGVLRHAIRAELFREHAPDLAHGNLLRLSARPRYAVTSRAVRSWSQPRREATRDAAGSTTSRPWRASK